jgi:carbonic anhydrase
VIEQVLHVCRTTIVEDAWRREQLLAVHGWIYDLRDGLLRDLHCTARGLDEPTEAYTHALRHVGLFTETRG